jgi:PKHD-type hydroxylase
MSSSRYFMNGLHRNETNHLNYYYFSNGFNDKEIKEIKDLASKLTKQDAVTGQGTVSTYRKSEVCWIDEEESSQWIYDKIGELAAVANKEMWNFDIWGFPDNLQYTIYHGNGGHYDWHLDLGPNMSNRKLSVVVQLAGPNEYEGGDLEINVGGSILTVPREKGLVCFFPSFLLHRVTPTTAGTRISLVTWLGGNNFR